MSTAVITRPVVDRVTGRREHLPIPMRRIIAVEMRKMFDTRAGFWMLVSIGILSVVATGAVIAFAPDNDLVYGNFAAAIGAPMSVVLPMIAVLAVTSEWSQRSGLTTFALVPSRGRVIAAKWVCTLVVGVASMLVAGAVGALGNVVGPALAGVGTTWDVTPAHFTMIVLANVLGMMMGFTLGVLLRSSAAAVVAYFVVALVWPNVSFALAGAQRWWHDAMPWLDFSASKNRLFDGVPTGEQWAQLATSGLLWLVLPLAVGLWTLMRSEVQ